MSYAMTTRGGRRAFGDVSVVLGVPVPTASGSPADTTMPNLFGDYEAHPLVKYMRAVMPASFGGPPSDAFNKQVQLALLAMEYQGQPVELLKVAVHSAAAANADTFTASIGDPSMKASLFNTNATIGYQYLIPVAEAVAAMPAPPKPMIQLNLGPVGAQIVACVKGKGTWTKTGCKLPQMQLNLGAVGKEIVACVQQGGKWTNGTCATTRQGVIWNKPSFTFVPVAAAAPPSPPASHLALYLGIGAAVAAVGAVAYMKMRRPASAPARA